ncbi:hypothetical protein I7I51_07474 [Histoplasma capsulatum]|uniref:Uncharacterized protein n=1 Tax=Ajellomyces capsulatus TaxID=5037 RepID=A0A8A1M063_AJECA|nr:hypothetical protein I7I51_07474 [Histoplasma capsulatum]
MADVGLGFCRGFKLESQVESLLSFALTLMGPPTDKRKSEQQLASPRAAVSSALEQPASTDVTNRNVAAATGRDNYLPVLPVEGELEVSYFFAPCTFYLPLGRLQGPLL